MSIDRPALRLVTLAPAEPVPTVRFCGHCAQPPSPDAESRICEHCQMGVVLEAGADLAPGPGDAFLVVDSHLSVSALSAAAAQLLGISEDRAVNRPVATLLAPADVAGNGQSSMAAALMTGDGPVRRLVVRPAGVYGVRLRARVGAVGHPPATLVVLERFGRRLAAAR